MQHFCTHALHSTTDQSFTYLEFKLGQSLKPIPVHVGPAEAFNLFPKTATSQAARDKLNKKTDNLPTVAEAGKELVGGSDPIGANSSKDVGKAVDKYALTSAVGFIKSSYVGTPCRNCLFCHHMIIQSEDYTRIRRESLYSQSCGPIAVCA